MVTQPRLGRRSVLAGGAAALAAAGLSGCGSPTSISSNPKELVLWYWNRSLDDGNLKAAATNIPGTDFKLRADIIGGNFDTKLRTSLAAGSYIPDVSNINSNCALYFPNEDQFIDLNTLGAEDKKGDYYEWKWQLGTSPSGKQIFFPIDTGPTGLFYRQDIFEKAGIDPSPEAVSEAVKTWEGYLAVGDKLKSANARIEQNGSSLFGAYINASPVRYFDANDQPVFQNDDSSIKKAWDNVMAAIEADVIGNLQTGNDQNAAYVSGATAGHIEAVWWADILKDTAPDTAGKWRLASQPMNPGNSGGSFMAVPHTCKNPEATFAFITWLQSPENQAVAYNNMSLFPASPKSFETGTIKNSNTFFGDQDSLSFFNEQAQAVPLTYISTYESLTGAFGRELTTVQSGAKSSDNGWNDAVEEVNRVLKKRGVIQ